MSTTNTLNKFGAEYMPYTRIAVRQVFTPPILTDDPDLPARGSWRGRGIVLLHFLTLPLKALAWLGQRFYQAARIVAKLFGVLTLNKHPKEILKVFTGVVDWVVGSVTAFVAIFANAIRCLIGIFHQKAMFKYDPVATWSPLLNQTLCFYPYKKSTVTVAHGSQVICEASLKLTH